QNIGSTFQHWPEESHGSVVMRSVYEGMEWLHEGYYTHDSMRAYEESGLQLFDKHIQGISKYLGYEVKLPEPVLMGVYQGLMERKRPQDAKQVLERLLQDYPVSPGVHYELGRVDLELNERASAEKHFRKALELYPGHGSARAELEKLGVDPQTVITETTVPPSVLRGHVGEYRYKDETSKVTLEDGKLFMNVGRDKRELRARSTTRFFAIESDREYTFNRKAGTLTIELPEFTYDSRKVR
ncbi:MAG: tetratricopeptide repeat protein, partial [Steroidobacter sp.]